MIPAMPAGTRAPTLTPRGWSLLGAALGLLVAARLLGALELAVLAVASIVLLGLGALWARAQRPALVVRRDVRPGRLHVGGEGRVDLHVVNASGRATPLLAATDPFGGGERAARLLLPRLLPGQAARAAYRIPTSRRGRYAVGPLTVDLSDPFGLTHRSFRVGGPDHVTVCPRVHAILPSSDSVGARATIAETVRARTPLPEGDEFLGLRDYEVGDDLRKVHWRSTARTGDLMIRQDEAWREPHAVLVLDTRPAAHSGPSFERAVEVAASVAARLARGERRLEVITSAGATLSRPGRGAEALLMDRLAVIEPGGGDRLPKAVQHARRRARAALLVVVAGALTRRETTELARLAHPGGPVVLVTTRAAQAEDPPPARSLLRLVDASTSASFVATWNAAVLARRRRSDAVSP